MSRAITVGKVAVLASSLLLGGTYICSQAGWVRLPFVSEKRPRAMMSSSKVRAIGPVLTSEFFNPPPPAVVQLDAYPSVMMASSKSGAVHPFRQSYDQSMLAQMAETNYSSTGVSPDLMLKLMPKPIVTVNAMPASSPGLIVGTLKLPSATTQPLAPTKVPSMNGTVPIFR